MQSLIKFTGVLGVLALAAPAFADEPNFTYAEAGYVRLNLDESEANPDGFTLKGSLAISESGFIRANYTDASDEVMGVDLDADAYSVGLGYQQPVAVGSAWYIAVDYVEADAEVAGISVDENGYSLGWGARSFVAACFEMTLELNYVDIEEQEGFAGTVGAIYHFNDRIGVTVDAGIDEEENSSAGVGVRFNF